MTDTSQPHPDLPRIDVARAKPDVLAAALRSDVVAFELRPPTPDTPPILARRIEVAVRIVLDTLAEILALATPKARDRGPVMITATGRAWFPFDPQAEDVTVDDFAPMLAKRCRWSGATSRFYSVAEHSIRVADRVAWRLGLEDLLVELRYRLLVEDFDEAVASAPAMVEAADTYPTPSAVRVVKAALLHDAAEAYTPDIPQPIKATRAASSFVYLERLATYAIGMSAGCLEELEADDPRIKLADDELLALEWRELIPDWHASTPLEDRVPIPAPPSTGPSSEHGGLDAYTSSPDGDEAEFRAYLAALDLVERACGKGAP